MMPRLVALLFMLCAGLAQAASPTVAQRPIDLDTGQGVLHGSLLLPQQATPPPVVLIIAGSGPTDRDGNNPATGRIDNLKRLALVLANDHIASVRCRPSAGWLSPATPDRRPQRRALCRHSWSPGAGTKADPQFGPLILVGHSERADRGLAAEQAGASAVITLAGVGRPLADVLREQLAQRLPPAQLARGSDRSTACRLGRPA